MRGWLLGSQYSLLTYKAYLAPNLLGDQESQRRPCHQLPQHPPLPHSQ
jgi:hypothetical protein